MKTEKTEMIMKYFDVTYKVAKQYEIILKDKQLRQIKAWYETKKGDGTISAESEEVLKEILNKGKILRKVLDEKSWWQPNQESIFGGFGQLLRLYLSQCFLYYLRSPHLRMIKKFSVWSKSRLQAIPANARVLIL